MARDLIKSDVTIRNTKPTDKTIRLSDGDGLYLLVKPNNAKWWRLDYSIAGKRKTLSVGVYPDVGLSAARERANTARTLVAEGIDPSAVRKGKKEAEQADKVASKRIEEGLPPVDSFGEVAFEWLDKKKASWQESNYNKINNRLKNDILPWLSSVPIVSIKAPDILAILRRIEERGAVNTAHQVRTTIGQILRYGVATGRLEYVVTDNLRGALTTYVETHYPAITDPKQLGDFLRAAEGYTGWLVVKSAIILTVQIFLRQGELRQSKWSYIDFDTGTWNLPAEDMKMKQPHIVPLSRQSLNILTKLKEITGESEYLFPNARGNGCMSENTVSMAYRAMGYTRDQVTPHGFRATARTLLDEVLGYRIEWIEQQLAHAVKDVHGRAYNRTAHLPHRKEMMQTWADYLDCLESGVDYAARKTV